ncbi:MAG: FG-GAP repeat protein [Blastocatellia bacterium]|nr:FG-GAP repeat protein [Blastocatellia bacterium]
MPACIRRSARAVLAALSVAILPILAIPSTTIPVGGTAARESPAAAPAPSSFEAEAMRSISEREYEATDAGEGLQAPNRANDLRTYFVPEGARVVDREGGAADLARLRTVSVGTRLVGKGEVVADGARVEVRRPGVVEWFENTERGLEHGWTLSERPPGEGSLAIEVAFDAPIRLEGDRAIVDAGGRLLEYGGLAAWDAAGATLAARLEEAGGDRLRIVVDDVGAEYPITVDPTLSSPVFATLLGDQASCAMGSDVSGAGDVNNDGFDDIIVGASLYDAGSADEGAAFIFLGGPNGISLPAATRLESNQTNAAFGLSVAGAGDVDNDGYDDVIVGADTYDAGQTDEGAAFVFRGGPSGIPNGNPSTAATILQVDQVSAGIGISVAGAGDVNDDGFADVIVGSVFYDSGQTDEGAAFVYLGSASGIIPTANAVLNGDQATSRMGISVDGAGDTNGDGYDDVIVGARLYDLGQFDEGAAFVFLGGSAGITIASATAADATLEGNLAGALMGASVASAGDLNNDGFADVVVGANAYNAGQSNEGAVFVFLGGAAGVGNGGPTSADTFLQSNQIDGQLGTSVAGAGDVNGDGYDDLLVGARVMNLGTPQEGGVFLYFGGASGVPSEITISSGPTILQQDQALAFFGTSVAGVGDVNGDGYSDVVASAPGYNGIGAAFVYLGQARGLQGFPKPDTVTRSGQAESGFGSVAGAGDVNADGYADIIVGAGSYDAGQTNEGAAFIFHGGPNGIPVGDPSVAATFLQGNQAGAFFGLSVAGAGDVNSDGYADVVVGSNWTSGQPAEGAAFVFHGGPSGIANGSPATAAAILQADQDDSSFSAGVASAGDVNNDGYDDVIVGARLYDIGQTDAGAAFVFHGGPEGVENGTPANADAFLGGIFQNDYFGSVVGGAGDTNGDGYDDAVVTASFPNGTQSVHVYLGSFGGLASTATTTLNSGQSLASLDDVASAGDVNADGYADIVVGSYLFDGSRIDDGAAFVIHGGPSGIPSGSIATVADTSIFSGQAGSLFGIEVATASDVNNDGYDDILIGADNYVDNIRRTVFVFLGGPAGIVATGPRDAAATLVAPVGPGFAYSVELDAAGDVNGDGFDDVVVGLANYDGTIVNEGGAFVYYLSTPDVPAGAGTDTVGIYVGSTGAWFLRNSNASGGADVVFGYGPAGLGWTPLAGDWNGDGSSTIGLYNPANGFFFLRNDNSPGPADTFFGFGPGGLGWLPLVGDWDGDGDDTVGLYSPSNGFFFLRNSNAPGGADVTFGFGPGGLGWAPIVGDWDGDGTDTIGLYSPSNGFFFLRNQNAPGAADLTFGFGPGGLGWLPLAGDWDGDGDVTVGLYEPSSGFFFLRNQNAPGAADLVFGYGPANVTPLVGDWDGQ